MNVAEPDEDSLAAWAKWVSERPAHVRAVIEKHGFRPWALYRMKSTGQRVVIYAFDEEDDDSVTLKVDVTREFNLVAFERRVFGVKPDNLEECDLPKEGELLGSLDLGVQDARAMVIDGIRNGLLMIHAAWNVETLQAAREWFVANRLTLSPTSVDTAMSNLEHWARIEKAIAGGAS